jgi:transcription initiation factor TFIIIB Brf1 subunit/transcription initiation factor TFIIB
MTCPYCGSQEIIYDYIHGYIVCTLCGSVIDTIFLEFFEERLIDSENFNRFEGLPSIRKGIEKKKIKTRLKIYTRMNFEILVYEKYAKKARKNVVIDIDAALRKETHIKSHERVYHHKDEDKVLNTALKDPVVNQILEYIVNRDPVLSSRTPRGKIALAIIIKNFIDNNPIDISELCRLTSMSIVHIRRLITLAKKRLPYIKKYVNEVKNNIVLNYTPYK